MDSGSFLLHHLAQLNQAKNLDRTEELSKLGQAINFQELGHQKMADKKYEAALEFFIKASDKFLELRKKSKNEEIVNIARIRLTTLLDEVIHFNIIRVKSAKTL